MSDVIAALSWVNDIIFVSLVNTTLQITLLILLIGLIIRVFRIKSAPTRYSLWLFAMLATLMLPILTPFTPQIDLARLHQQKAAGYGPGGRARLGMEAGDAGDMSMANVSVESIVAAEGASTGKMDISIVNPVSIVYFIWCAGALSMLFRTIVVYGKLRRLRLCSSDVDSQVALEVLSRLREKLGIRRAVALKSSSRVYAPISLGVFSPTIILPGGMLEGESMDELEMILVHELAHIKRFDYLARLLQKVLKVFLFFHPLFHLMKRNLAREREHICDDWVIHVTSHKSRYAEYLLDMLERVVCNPVNVPVTLAMAGRKQDIPRRVDMIVDKKRTIVTKISKKALIAVFLIGCLSLPVIGGIGLIRFAGSAPTSGKAQIAFESYRDGNYEVYVMDVDGKNQCNLTENPAWDAGPSWSPDGQRIAFHSTRAGNSQIYVMDADGKNPLRLSFSLTSDWGAAWSPDGQKIAFVRVEQDGNSEIYVIDADGKNPRNLTNNPANDAQPHWSPDGRISFHSNRDGSSQIYVMNVDGKNLQNLTKNHPKGGACVSWSRDGQSIAFARWHGTAEIYVMDADGENPRRLTNNAANDKRPAWSPDGKWIAFYSDRDGNGEIYVMDADGSNPRRLTNNPADDNWPAWFDPAFAHAVYPAGKLKGTWGKIKALLPSH